MSFPRIPNSNQLIVNPARGAPTDAGRNGEPSQRTAEAILSPRNGRGTVIASASQVRPQSRGLNLLAPASTDEAFSSRKAKGKAKAKADTQTSQPAAHSAASSSKGYEASSNSSLGKQHEEAPLQHAQVGTIDIQGFRLFSKTLNQPQEQSAINNTAEPRELPPVVRTYGQARAKAVRSLDGCENWVRAATLGGPIFAREVAVARLQNLSPRLQTENDCRYFQSELDELYRDSTINASAHEIFCHALADVRNSLPSDIDVPSQVGGLDQNQGRCRSPELNLLASASTAAASRSRKAKATPLAKNLQEAINAAGPVRSREQALALLENVAYPLEMQHDCADLLFEFTRVPDLDKESFGHIKAALSERGEKLPKDLKHAEGIEKAKAKGEAKAKADKQASQPAAHSTALSTKGNDVSFNSSIREQAEALCNPNRGPVHTLKDAKQRLRQLSPLIQTDEQRLMLHEELRRQHTEVGSINIQELRLFSSALNPPPDNHVDFGLRRLPLPQVIENVIDALQRGDGTETMDFATQLLVDLRRGLEWHPYDYEVHQMVFQLQSAIDHTAEPRELPQVMRTHGQASAQALRASDGRENWVRAGAVGGRIVSREDAVARLQNLSPRLQTENDCEYFQSELDELYRRYTINARVHELFCDALTVVRNSLPSAINVPTQTSMPAANPSISRVFTLNPSAPEFVPVFKRSQSYRAHEPR